MNSDSCLDTNISEEMNNQLQLYQSSQSSQSSQLSLNEKPHKSEHIVDVISEMRVDILRILTIMKKMENQIQALQEKVNTLETNTDDTSTNSSTNSNTNDYQHETSSTNLSTSISDINKLNEYEAKLDKFKIEVNDEFMQFKEQMIIDFTKFKNGIIQSSRLR